MSTSVLQAPPLEGVKGRVILSMLVAQSWRDVDYKQRLIDAPKAILAEEGIQLPEHIKLHVVEETEIVKYISLSRAALDPNNVEAFSSLIARLSPLLAEEFEVRLVQNTETNRYIVLPLMPIGLDPTGIADAELLKLAVAGSSVEATETATTQTTVAETTEAAVAETSEAEAAETTTTVVAEVELVAT